MHDLSPTIIRSGNDKFPYDLYTFSRYDIDYKLYLKDMPDLGKNCSHLIIKRLDGKTPGFEEIQDIKYALCGNSEAIQIYPVEMDAEHSPTVGTVQLYIFPKDLALNLPIFSNPLPI